MKGNRMDGGSWTRREVFRVGSMATAAGVLGRVDAIEGAIESQTSKVSAAAKGPQIYTRIGVRPFINLTGTLTINGGALERPEVRGRVTFAYNAISHVSITLKPTRGVGFHVDDAV